MLTREIFFKTIPSVLLILLPLSLITGPFISDLSISIIVIIFITKCVAEKNFNYFNNVYFKYFMVFYFICLISSLISDFKLISSIKSFFYFRFGIFALCVWHLLSENKMIIKYIFVSLFLCFCILVFDGFIQYIYEKNIIGLPKHGIRLSSFFGDELILGSYLSRFLPILIGVFFLTNYSKNKIILNIFFLFIILSIILIYVTGERASFLLSVMSITYIFVMLNKYSKDFLIILIISSLIILLINFNNPDIKQRMISFTKEQLGLSEKPVVSEYVGHFLIAKDLFKENPILGVGPKNYVKHCTNNKKFQAPPYLCTTHPHNTYIQLLSETGLLGASTIFLIFIIFSFFSAKHIYFKLFKKIDIFSISEICILSSMLITLWPITSSGSFFNNYINIIYFFPVGIFIWLRNN